jgi:uncharacterized surface protein with fasciclin (FAS1) repeats
MSSLSGIWSRDPPNEGARMRAMRRTAIAVVSVAAALTLSACGGLTEGATTIESSSAIKGGAAEPVDGSAVIEEETDVMADDQELSSNSVCPDISPADIATCLESNGNFTYFLTGGLGYLLDNQFNGGPVTVFAPTDDAFKALGVEFLDLLSEDTELVEKIIAHHVKDGVYLTPDFFVDDPRFIDVVGFCEVIGDLDGVLTVDGAVVAPWR